MISEKTGRRARLGRIRRSWERVRSEPGLGRNVLVVTGLVLLASLVGGWILGNQNFTPPWDDRMIINATFEGTPGINPGHGQEVRVAGVPVGDIRDVSVDDRGHAKVELAIDRSHQVYDDATVVLRPKSPLNEMYVMLDPGTPAGKRLQDGDTLPVTASRRPIQVDEVLAHLDDDTRNALSTLIVESDAALSTAPESLPGGLRATQKLLADLRPVVEALDDRRKTLAKLVTAVGQVSTAVGEDDVRLARLATALRTTLSTTGKHGPELDSLLGQLPDLSSRLRESTQAVQHLSGQLDPTLDNVRDAAQRLPDSLGRVSGTADRIGSTMDSFGPLVRNARPVVKDLRPLTGDLVESLTSLSKSTRQLDPVTKVLVDYRQQLGAFVINTRSLTTLADANGGITRAQLQFGLNQLPVKPPRSGDAGGR